MQRRRHPAQWCVGQMAIGIRYRQTSCCPRGPHIIIIGVSVGFGWILLFGNSLHRARQLICPKDANSGKGMLIYGGSCSTSSLHSRANRPEQWCGNPKRAPSCEVDGRRYALRRETGVGRNPPLFRGVDVSSVTHTSDGPLTARLFFSEAQPLS